MNSINRSFRQLLAQRNYLFPIARCSFYRLQSASSLYGLHHTRPPLCNRLERTAGSGEALEPGSDALRNLHGLDEFALQLGVLVFRIDRLGLVAALLRDIFHRAVVADLAPDPQQMDHVLGI